ncbi:adenosine transporter 1 [Trypanosoma equiperdum]|uniref:Adenosine transporter, putative n=2 Tax=Trypanozoon TaxID=39700 RepID=Q38EK0_TRYB2|nr:adenosine transporter, putative [Trypanosoma brucei brucei TREU927]EAN76770.1 adenosine transporter, putative [Trypanosoma brucei brucei TREU927]SCU70468.1 adenosine transporter 1 [Trypanosoma equiperdum]
MLGFESFSEFVVYVTFIFFGMSVMMVTNAIYSIPAFFTEYYKYAQGSSDAQTENENFWNNILTYYNAAVFSAQVLLETFMLTNVGRRIPIRIRLIFGLTIPLVELIALILITVCHTSEAGAKATIIIIALVGGVSKTLCDSSNAALVGPFPTRFYGAIVWGLGVSGLITSLMSIIIKASMDDSFESMLTQSRIYFGIVIFIQVIACVLLALLTKNPYAIKYAAEFRHAAAKESAVESNEPVQETITDQEANAGEEGERVEKSTSKMNVLNVSEDPDKMKDTDQVDGTTNAQQMLDANLWFVVKRIWPMLVSCFFVFFATLLVFPGVFFAVEVKDGWYITLTAAMFNFGDFLSRLVLQFKQLRPSPIVVLIGTFARLLIIPLLVLCVRGIIPGSALPYILCLLWGLTNGYFGGMSMIYAPRTGSLTTAGQRSLAAICGNLALLLGLFAGSMLALAVMTALPES